MAELNRECLSSIDAFLAAHKDVHSVFGRDGVIDIVKACVNPEDPESEYRVNEILDVFPALFKAFVKRAPADAKSIDYKVKNQAGVESEDKIVFETATATELRATVKGNFSQLDFLTKMCEYAAAQGFRFSSHKDLRITCGYEAFNGLSCLIPNHIVEVVLSSELPPATVAVTKTK